MEKAIFDLSSDFLTQLRYMPQLLLRKSVICRILHRLAPLVGGFLAGHLYRNVGKPTVLFGPVPVLDLCRNGDDRTRGQTLDRLPFLLIPSLSCGADQDLSPTAFRMMDMPVVAAAWLKGDICQEYRTFARFRQGIQIGIADDIVNIS